MADEQPNTHSADVTTSDAPAAEPASSDASSESSESPSWWQRITRRQPRQETERQTQESAGNDQSSQALTLTQEELDRRVQAETDRREAKRAQEAAARRRKELRDTDPWAYAEEDRKADSAVESEQTMVKFFTDLGAEHDKVSIDPVVELLPQPERERIAKLEGAGKGLEGRKLVVTESLKALERHWKAEGAKEAESKLRKNPAFRKQVLSEGRDGAVEPELLPAASASAADQTISALLRRHYDLG